MLIVLIACSLLQGHGTYLPAVEFGGVTVAQLCSEITKISGVEVSAAPDLAGEIVIIECPAMPLATFLNSVAVICDARLEQVNDGYRIGRSSELRRELQRGYKERRTQRIALAIDKWKVASAGSENLERQAAFLIEDFKSRSSGLTTSGTIPTPTALLLRDVVASIGATRLAAVAPGSSEVFCDSPSASETALPDVSRAIRDYRERQFAILNLLPERPPVEAGSAAANLAIESSWLRIKEEVKSATRATTILVDCVAGYDYMLVALSVFDEHGEQIARIGHRFDISPLDVPAAAEWEASLGKVPVTPETAALLELPWTTTSAIPFNFKAIERAVIPQKLLSGERDLFSSHLSDVLRTWSKKDSVAVFVRPSDTVLESKPIWMNSKHADLALLVQTLRQSGHRTQRRNDVLLIWPTDAIETEMKRTPRLALIDLIQSCKSRGVLDIEDYSRFCYKAYGSAYRGLLGRTRALLPALGVPKETALYPYDGSGYVYTILGGLSRFEWQRSAEGVALSWTRLDRIQKHALLNWFSLRVADSALAVPILQRRGTRAFPITAQLTVNIGRSQRPAARLVNPGGGFFTEYPFARSASQLANQIAYSVGTGEYASIDAALAGEWTPDRQEVLELKLKRDEMQIADRVDGPASSQPRIGRAQPYAELPEAFRREVDREVRNFGKG